MCGRRVVTSVNHRRVDVGEMSRTETVSIFDTSFAGNNAEGTHSFAMLPVVGTVARATVRSEILRILISPGSDSLRYVYNEAVCGSRFAARFAARRGVSILVINNLVPFYNFGRMCVSNRLFRFSFHI